MGTLETSDVAGSGDALGIAVTRDDATISAGLSREAGDVSWA